MDGKVVKTHYLKLSSLQLEINAVFDVYCASNGNKKERSYESYRSVSW